MTSSRPHATVHICFGPSGSDGGEEGLFGGVFAEALRGVLNRVGSLVVTSVRRSDRVLIAGAAWLIPLTWSDEVESGRPENEASDV